MGFSYPTYMMVNGVITTRTISQTTNIPTYLKTDGRSKNHRNRTKTNQNNIEFMKKGVENTDP